MRGQKVAVVTIDPAKRLASALGLRGALGRAAPHRGGADGAGVKIEGELWAMMLDVKRTFDDIVARLASRRAGARGDPRQPRLPRALDSGRRLAGAERGRQALRALRGARLRRDRARHAAVAQRARLPRRTEPPARLPRRPRAAGVPRAGRLDRAPVRARHGARSSRSSRASPASTCSASCRASSARSAA